MEMKSVKFVLLAAASLAISVQGASFKSEIALLPGEVWWGGGGGDGQNQPYGLKDSRRINLRRSGATASPLLVSSAGRYVWSEKPFEYQFAKGVLRLDSRVERIEPVVAGYKFDAGGAHYFESGCRMFDPKAEGVDYTRLYAEFAAREFPYHEIRVSWKCGGLPLVTRLNDRAHAWTGGSAQDTVIPQIIAVGMLGCPYALGDMVGGGLDHTFLGRKIDEKLFVRSAAMQSLLPMMQFSAAPWRHSAVMKPIATDAQDL